MFSSLISPFPRSKTPHLNPYLTDNGTRVSTSSEFLAKDDPLPSTHAMREFLSAEETGPTNKSFSNEKRKYNSFTIASTEDPLQEDDLIVSGEQKAEDEFFRNMYSYLDDCERNKNGPSPLQMLLYLTANNDTPLAMPVIQRGLSRMIRFFGGVVAGEWLPAFKRSYPEYMDGVELDELEELEEMSEK